MAQSLRDILSSSIDKALTENNAAQAKQLLPTASSPNPVPPRSYASPQDVYEDEVGYVSPFLNHSPGMIRPRWAIPDVALTHTPVSSLISSGTPVNTQENQIVGGVVSGVQAPASGWAPVPNMQVSVVANGPLHIVANLSVKSNVASDVISFAFYRDAQQFGQIFTHTTPSATNSASLVGLSIIDSPVVAHSLLNRHVYALYWKAGTGLLSSASTAQRSLYSINLTPQ